MSVDERVGSDVRPSLLLLRLDKTNKISIPLRVLCVTLS